MILLITMRTELFVFLLGVAFVVGLLVTLASVTYSTRSYFKKEMQRHDSLNVVKDD